MAEAKLVDEINKMVGHTEEISEADRRRNPSMHHTDTLDRSGGPCLMLGSMIDAPPREQQ